MDNILSGVVVIGSIQEKHRPTQTPDSFRIRYRTWFIRW
jgi:hypothetical protein